MLLAAQLGLGQSTPAPTSWQKFPTPSVNPPAPTHAPPPALPGPSAPGSRVVVFTKPAGDVRPVQGTDADKKDEPIKPPTPPKETPSAGGGKGNPFKLQSDDELVAEIDADRKYDQMVKDYETNKLPEYERELDRFKKGLREKEPTKPTKPLAVPLIERPQAALQSAVKAGYAPHRAVLEPGYVVHRRLLFEEKNSDRYGWELGYAQPVVSTLYFYKDVLLFPGHIASGLFERYDTSAGKCPPGSPVPYYLYPPQMTLRGGIVEAGVVAGTVLLLP